MPLHIVHRLDARIQILNEKGQAESKHQTHDHAQGQIHFQARFDRTNRRLGAVHDLHRSHLDLGLHGLLTISGGQHIQQLALGFQVPAGLIIRSQPIRTVRAQPVAEFLNLFFQSLYLGLSYFKINFQRPTDSGHQLVQLIPPLRDNLKSSLHFRMFFSVPLLLHLGHILQGLQILLLGGGRGGVFQIQGRECRFQLLNAQIRHLFQPHLS